MISLGWPEKVRALVLVSSTTHSQAATNQSTMHDANLCARMATSGSHRCSKDHLQLILTDLQSPLPRFKPASGGVDGGLPT